MTRGFFITGTDTGVGKTLIAAALVHHYAQTGLRAAGMKPVVAGREFIDGQAVYSDIVQLRAAGNVALPPEVLNPYAFEPPLAPHVAADRAGVRIELERIHAAFKKAADAVDILVVEGVGGFRVPLNEDEDTADLAVRLGLPVVLVVGMRLGCLNHAMLTAESITARELPFAGWVANGIDPAMDAWEENLHALQKRLTAPCLGVVSFRKNPDFRTVSTVFGEMASGI